MLIALRETRREILRNPFRSFLVLQGIIWGTALAILAPALFEGSRKAALERAAELGTDRIVILAEANGGSPFGWEVPDVLARTLGEEMHAAAAYAFKSAPADGKGFPVILVDLGAKEAGRREIAAGRWLSDDEVLAGAHAAVLEPAAAEALRKKLGAPSDEALLGVEVALGDGLPPPRVVGVSRPRPGISAGLDLLGYEKDHPLSELLYDIHDSLGIRPRQAEWLSREDNVIVPRRRYPGALPSAVELRTAPAIAAQVSRRAREALLEKGMDPIVFHNPIVQIIFGEDADTLERVHWIIFCGCLIVGSAAVACLRILTVIERREEIAIRRVEGATLLGVGIQLAVETSAFCLAGALAGLPLAFFLAWLRANLDPSGTVAWTVPVAEVFITLGCVVLVGLLGGILPALRAGAMEPAEILGRG